MGVFENRSFTAEEHHEWVFKLWNRMDRDHTGSLTREKLNCDEFQDVLHAVIAPDNCGEAHRATYGRAEMHIQQALDFLLRKATLNADGSISFNEFKSFMRMLRNQGDEHDRVHLIFALFDLDGSNTINREEFIGIYSFFCGHSPTLIEVNNAFAQMDKYDKHEVTRNQFIRWMKTDAPEAFRHHAAKVEEEDKPLSPKSAKRKEKAKPKIKKIHRPAPGLFEPRPDNAETWTNSWHVFWNDRFRGRDHSLMNPTCPERLKHYFSAPQTLPELEHFYCNYKGFEKHYRDFYRKEPPKRRPVLSTESKTLDVNGERARPGGTATNSKGDPVLWNDQWQDKASDYTQRVKPGSLLLRCPAKPSPILLLGRDADHYAYRASLSAPLLKPLSRYDRPAPTPTF